MNKYSVKLKNNNSILWVHANSENLAETMSSFDYLGFSVDNIIKQKRRVITANMGIK
jgi:N6-adenosine-specific RNA methylase IME4